MSDLIDDPRPGQNMPEYTVSEVSGAVKKTLEDQFGLTRQLYDTVDISFFHSLPFLCRARAPSVGLCICSLGCGGLERVSG